MQRSGPSHCWCKVKRLRRALAKGVICTARQDTPPAPQLCPGSPSTTNCFPAHGDSHKYGPKPGGRPGTGYPQLVRPARCRLQVRCCWWAGTAGGCARTVTAQPCRALAGRGTAAAAWHRDTLSPLVPQPAQGAQRVSTGLLGFTPSILRYSCLHFTSPLENLKIGGWNQSCCNFSDCYQELA